eukprot:TRINITY_DN26550_c0_g1_i1.p1 TRINITY_DN26550_c0_g1~~TRINITY_DN26550_c0_g1_i1.p1  ORF type:complete len:235 (-),score=45.05 TRINITY_DN26550_c0_g1_i1:23-685(-)
MCIRDRYMGILKMKERKCVSCSISSSRQVPSFTSQVQTSSTKKGERSHLILYMEEEKIKEIVKEKSLIEQRDILDSFLQNEYLTDQQIMEERKLNLYCRSRWATTLEALGRARRTSGCLKQEFFANLKKKIKEKIIFELMNPSLAKIMRSRTPPADAPRKIREEFRKKHPLDEEEDNFPSIEMVLSKPVSAKKEVPANNCLLYTSPSPRDLSTSRMPSSA